MISKCQCIIGLPIGYSHVGNSLRSGRNESTSKQLAHETNANMCSRDMQGFSPTEKYNNIIRLF